MPQTKEEVVRGRVEPQTLEEVEKDRSESQLKDMEVQQTRRGRSSAGRRGGRGRVEGALDTTGSEEPAAQQSQSLSIAEGWRTSREPCSPWGRGREEPEGRAPGALPSPSPGARRSELTVVCSIFGCLC